MRVTRHLLHLPILLSLFLLSEKVDAQSLKVENETIYLSEVLTHTSENAGRDVHFIGWLLNTTRLNLGTKHSISVGAMLTHGGEPSANIVGDLQTFSNLEAGSLYGFYELYYRYQKEGFWIKLGQQDLNTDFLVSENALLFTHSSFGIDPVTTINIPAPTYPPTALALTSSINIGESSKLRLGVFDGQFATRNDNFLTLNWRIPKDEGLLYIIEPELKLLKGRLIQKVGFYHHSGQIFNYETQRLSRGLSAFYLVSDFLISTKEDQSANLFFQFSTSSESVSDIKDYFGLGLRLANYIKGKPNEIGMAIGHARLNSQFEPVAQAYNLSSETVVEVNYKQEFSSRISIQPYFQWIDMNEVTSRQRNPLIFALRAYFEF